MIFISSLSVNLGFPFFVCTSSLWTYLHLDCGEFAQGCKSRLTLTGGESLACNYLTLVLSFSEGKKPAISFSK